MNVVEMVAHFNRRRQGEWTAESSPLDPHDFLISMFNQANAEIQEASRLVKGVSAISTTSGATDFTYALPVDLLNDLFDEEMGVSYTAAASGSKATPLTRIDAGRARQLYENFTNSGTNNTAKHWWIDQATGQMGIGWPPGEAGTLTRVYAKDPDPIDNSIAIVAGASGQDLEVTVGSTAVTKSGATALAEIAIPAANECQLGFGTLASPPTRWYDISAIAETAGDITGLTLAENFAASADQAATSDWVIAYVDEVQRSIRSRALGVAAVHYALWQASTPGDLTSVFDHRGDYERLLSRFSRSYSGMTLRDSTEALDALSFGAYT